MKKKYVAWYLPKQDKIIEVEANVSYGLIICLIRWDRGFNQDAFIYLGVI